MQALAVTVATLTKQIADLTLVNEVLQLLEVILEVLHTDTHLVLHFVVQYKHLSTPCMQAFMYCFTTVSHAQHKLSSH
jgi:hypothetical protein